MLRQDSLGSSKNGKIISSFELFMVKFVREYHGRNTLLKSSLVNFYLFRREAFIFLTLPTAHRKIGHKKVGSPTVV